MKKIFDDIDNWLSAKGAWPVVVFLTFAAIGLFLDQFFLDHNFYPEFLKNWNPIYKGLLVTAIVTSPLIIYYLFKGILKDWKNRDN